MIIQNLKPSPIDKFNFKLSSIKNIPKESGCYVLTTFSGDILYIGLAVNLQNRFKQHLDNINKISPTSNGKAVWFYFKLYDPKNLNKLERSWINQYVETHGEFPILNKVNSPI